MVSKIVLINIGLSLICGFFVLKTYQVWQEDPIAVHLSANRASDRASKATKSQSSNKVSHAKQILPKSAYQDTATKNLFAAERSEYKPAEPEIEAPVEVEIPKVDGRQISLFGVVLLDGYASALISDPEIKPGGKPTRWVKPGERIGQLKVDEILKQSVILSGNGKKYRISLYDNKKQRSGGAVAQSSKPTVVTTKSKPKISTKPKKEPKSDEEYEMVSTPFGIMKRKKK